jgi:hypothetical protein
MKPALWRGLHLYLTQSWSKTSGKADNYRCFDLGVFY